MELLRVLLADDDPLVRGALRDALAHERDIVLAGEAVDGAQAIAMAVELRPDIVLMDAELPVVDGFTATLRIRRQAPEVKVVLLAAGSDVELGLLALRAGAAGFLMKDVSAGALARTLRSVDQGEAGVTRAFAMRLIERLRRQSDDGSGLRPVHSDLTSREWQVLDLLCAGASIDAIAAELALSTETVRAHVKHVLAKLGAGSRAEAVAIAAGLRIKAGTGSERADIDELALRRMANRLKER